MGELKKEFDNATCPQSLALILSIYFASQIDFSIKKERHGRENPSCSNISSPFSFLHGLPTPVPVSISLPHYRITVGGFFKSIKIIFVLLFNLYRCWYIASLYCSMQQYQCSLLVSACGIILLVTAPGVVSWTHRVLLRCSVSGAWVTPYSTCILFWISGSFLLLPMHIYSIFLCLLRSLQSVNISKLVT